MFIPFNARGYSYLCIRSIGNFLSLEALQVIAVFKIIESPEKWSAKDDPNHERIVKTPIGVYKKVCLFARSLVYISLRVSGCPVCTFCILFLKKILTFTKRRFRDYSAITNDYKRLQVFTCVLALLEERLQMKQCYFIRRNGSES